ncbi:hypothetical protein ACJMK2_016322, partial [Sinanodonta woodiana]
MFSILYRLDDESTHVNGILNIKIQNEFDEVPFISGQLSATIQENQPADTVLYGLFDIIDADVGDTFNYTLSGTHASFFKIDSSTGLITTTQSFDYEGEITTFDDLLLTVTDKGGNSANVSLLISISDVNEYTPTFNQSTYVVSIDEDALKDTSVIELFATDGDISQSLSYSVKYGDPWRFFIFDGTKPNQLSTNNCINLDSPDNHAHAYGLTDNHPHAYGLTAVVTDDGSPEKTGTTYVMITVNRKNDNAPVFGATSPNSTLSIPEDSPIWTTAATVTASDADHDIFSYRVLEGNTDNKFAVNPTSGEIVLMQTLDSEKQISYEFIIQAVDKGFPPMTASTTVTVSLIDVNDNKPMCSQSIFTASVSESATIGDTVSHLNCTDADSGDTLAYTITFGNIGDAFSIDNNGNIYVNNTLDYDYGIRSYSLVVEVDDGINSASVLIIICITPVNEHEPVFAGHANITLPEETNLGISLLFYTATDEDAYPHNITSYRIESGNDRENFVVNRLSGELFLVRSLDFDIPLYELSIVAEDGGGHESTGTVTIYVVDANDQEPSCCVTLHTISVAENTVVWSTLISDLCCSDEDPKTVLSYALTQIPDGNDFTINTNGSASLQLLNSLDFETESSYELNVVVSDNGAPSKSTTTCIHISVLDINEGGPTFSNNVSATVPESAGMGYLILQVNASDPDSPGSPYGNLLYSIISGNDDGKFAIDSGSGELFVIGTLDFDSNQKYELVTQAVEEAGIQSAMTTLTIMLQLSWKDGPPVCLEETFAVTIPEDTAVGTVILTLNCSDVEGQSDLSYVINSTSARLHFKMINNTLLTKSLFNYEIGVNMFFLTVDVTDGNNTLQIYGTVRITDVNEFDPIFTLGSSNGIVTISEASPISTSVITLTAVDFDTDDVVTYAFLNHEALFTLDLASGLILLKENLDFEIVNQYTIHVIATDGNRTSRANVTVNVGDANDHIPFFTQEHYSVTMEENVGNQAIVSLGAWDEDYNSQPNFYGYYMFDIQDGNKHGIFSIDFYDGSISITCPLDYEIASSYSLRVMAYDTLGFSGSRSSIVIVHVEVLNENEYAPRFISKSYNTSVSENARVGTFVTQVSATDDDTGEDGVVKYSLTDKYFYVDECTGKVHVRSPVDFESMQQHSLMITATDMGTPAKSDATIIYITVQNANDTYPVCASSLHILQYAENQTVGTILPAFKCKDVGAVSNGVLSYSIVSVNGGPTSPEFSINSSTGEIILVSSFDYESTSSFYILVAVSDDGLASMSFTVTYNIIITDINEHTPSFSKSTYNIGIAEATAVDKDVLVLKATDDDISDSITYSIKPENSDFEINPTTGVIKTTTKLNRTLTPVYNLTVYAADNGTSPYSRTSFTTVLITITNSTAPVFLSIYYETSVSENANEGTTVLSVSASDPDDAILSFSIWSGDTRNVFTIDTAGNIVVQDATSLDYETTSSYNLTIAVVDQRQQTGTTIVSIHVTGYNEFAPVFTSFSSIVSLPEDTAMNHVVMTAVANDSDSGDDGLVNYSFLSGARSKFTIDSITGTIRLVANLDAETISLYKIVIAAVDMGHTPGKQTTTSTLTIIITDVNDNAPTCESSLYIEQLIENVNIGTNVTKIECSDNDIGYSNGAMSYTIAFGNTQSIFAVSSTGQVATASFVDREMYESFQLIIKISDSGTPSFTTTVTVSVIVQDKNEYSPTFDHGDLVYNIPENTPVGTFVGKVNATDMDAGQAGVIIFSKPHWDWLNCFQIDYRTGVIRTQTTLESIINQFVYMEIMAYDADPTPRSASVQVSVFISSVQSSSPVCDSNVYEYSVLENITTGTVVGSIYCSDADGDNLTYSLLSGNDKKLFYLNVISNGVEVMTVGELYKETQYIHQLYIQISDNNNYEYVNVTISVEHINENAPNIVSTGNIIDINENTDIAVKVYEVNATDADLSSGILYYFITSGNSENKFWISDTTGVIQLQNYLDREKTSAYNLTIEVTDGNVFTSLTGTASLIVRVTDFNDNYPICDKEVYITYADENAAMSTTIASPSCYDNDSSSQDLMFVISFGANNMFSIDNSTGELTLSNTLDYENMTSYFLTVTVDDQGSPALTSTIEITIWINPINDNNPVFDRNYTAYVAENASLGSDVIQVTASDADVGLNHGIVRYSIVSGDIQSKFLIDSVDGTIRVAGALDREAIAMYILIVVASDCTSGSPDERSSSTMVIIHVTDINDNYPVFNPSIYSMALQEDTVIGTTIIQLSATDMDDGISGTPGLYYNIVGGNNEEIFNMSGNYVILQRDIDHFTTAAQYLLKIQAKDQGSKPMSSFTYLSVKVIAVNEYRPVFVTTVDTIFLYENASVGTVIYTFSALDNDTGKYGKLKYAIVDWYNHSVFYVDEDSGELLVSSELDFENGPRLYNLTIEVTDNSGESNNAFSNRLFIFAQVMDSNDNKPVCINNRLPTSSYTMYMDEGVDSGYTLRTAIAASDRDTGINAEVTFSIVNGESSGLFSINSSSGFLATNASTFDYEITKALSLLVRVSDKGFPSLSTECRVKIILNDVNDNAPVFQAIEFTVSIPESSEIDTTITSVTASDADSNANNNNVFTYMLESLYFIINSTSGIITCNNTLDREMTPSYILKVYAIDRGAPQLTGTATVTVQIEDINDNDPVISGTYNTTIYENIDVNTEVFKILATDNDIGKNSALTFAIKSGINEFYFKIDVLTGSIRVRNALDRETSGEYLLEITVYDNGDAQRTASINATVVVLDVNDNPPVFSPSVYGTYVMENETIGTTVLQVHATDEDLGIAGTAGLIYSIVGGNTDDAFVMDRNNIVLSKDIDYMTSSKYLLKIKASDQGLIPLISYAYVTISVVAVNEYRPTFNAREISISTYENASIGTTIFTFSATDDDTGQYGKVKFYLINGSTHGQFTIDETSGDLMVDSQLDYDSLPQIFNLTVEVQDLGDYANNTFTDNTWIVIALLDVNDNPPLFMFNGSRTDTYIASINEDAEIGYVFSIGINISDIDSGLNAHVAYSIVGGDGSFHFRIDASTGILSTTSTFDYETKSMYSVVVRATDRGSPAYSSNSRVKIQINDVNDNTPMFHMTDYSISISESSVIGTIVTVVIATDEDSEVNDNNVIIYALTSSYFYVDPSSGIISTLALLDRESMDIHNLTILAIDQGSPQRTGTLNMIVLIEDSNDNAPVISGTYDTSIAEDLAVGNIVLIITATDGDIDENAELVFSISSGNNNSDFKIDSSNGIIRTGNTLDRETISVYFLVITVSDSGTPRLSVTVTTTITILDVNDNNPVFSPAAYSVSILESIGTGSTIIQVTATDKDEGMSGTQGLQFSIVNGNTNSVFTVANDLVVIASDIDYVEKSQYLLKIQACDQGSTTLCSFSYLTVNVLPVNKYAPNFINGKQILAVSEDTLVGSTVFVINASDKDVGQYGILKYRIIAGNTDNVLSINEDTGELTLSSPLDFETSTRSYNVTIQVQDLGDNINNTNVNYTWIVMNLIDVNDNAPVFSSNEYNVSVYENEAAGYTFATRVTATDADSEQNQQLTYSILSTDGILPFEIDHSTGAISVKIASLDYESKRLYSFRIKASDNGTISLSSTCQMTIWINDINDNPPVFQASNILGSISEAVPIGTSVIRVVATDADSSLNNNNILVYFLESAYFTMDSNTGLISTRATLDRESNLSHTLMVMAIDQGSPQLTGTATVTVLVNDENDNGPVIMGNYDASVREDSAVNTEIFAINATDFDAGANGHLIYSIASGNLNDCFKIDSTTGLIQIKCGLDRETVDKYLLRIQVEDGGLPVRSSMLTATVTVLDVNDNAPSFSSTSLSFSVFENVPINSTVDRVLVTDHDVGTNGAFSIYIVTFWSGNPSDFVIDMLSGVVTTSAAIDREAMSSYNILLGAVDKGIPELSAYANLTISIADMNDITPTFASNSYSVSVLDNIDIGTSVLSVLVTDADSEVNSQITLMIDNLTTMGLLAYQYFGVNSSTSTIFLKQHIRSYIMTSVTFSLIATDAGTPPLSSSTTVTINISDVNDNPPIFVSTKIVSEIAYSNDCQLTVATVSATDADAGVNANVEYYFVQNNYQDLFNLDSVTGEIKLTGIPRIGNVYIFVVGARDRGIPSLDAIIPAYVKLQTFDPNIAVISFYMEISKTYFESIQSQFLSQLTLVFRTQYLTAVAKKWCVQELSVNSCVADIYAVTTDNTTTNSSSTKASGGSSGIMPEVKTVKGILSAQELLPLLTDSRGNLTLEFEDSNWDIFKILRIVPYVDTANGSSINVSEDRGKTEKSDGSKWIETTGGMVTVVVGSVVGIVVVVSVGMTIRHVRAVKVKKSFTQSPSNPGPKLNTCATVKPKIEISRVTEKEEFDRPQMSPAVVSHPLPMVQATTPVWRLDKSSSLWDKYVKSDLRSNKTGPTYGGRASFPDVETPPLPFE